MRNSESEPSRIQLIAQSSRASIVIPAFNEEKNLARLLPEINAQIGQHDEVIVVDNASHDNTAAVAGSLKTKVVVEPRRGRSRARNAGFRHARGNVIVFLDADCFPEKDWLRNLIEPFADEHVGCVGGEIVNADIRTPLAIYLAAKGHLSQRVTFAHPFLPFAQTGNVAFRRSVIEAIGGFDDRMTEGEDADLCWRMQLETNFQLVFAERAKVLHAHDLSPKEFLRQKRRHAYGAVLLYKKYRSGWSAEQTSVKRVYWEYRSILRRGSGYLGRLLLAKLGLSVRPTAEQGFQLLVEIGEKWGRIEGAIRHRVWFV
jgi:cellulose synthase/poly-beta-1,6-N-acetylglucosamine synthase-like glycosyltransferase